MDFYSKSPCLFRIFSIFVAIKKHQLNINIMKKTLIIALAGMMLFAFTQCGGGKNENGKDDKAKTETKTVKASKQFTEMKEAFDEVEKMIKDTKDCEELKEAAFAVALGALAVELGGDEYTAEDKMTEKEKEQFNKIIEDLSNKAQKKAEQLGCDLSLDE